MKYSVHRALAMLKTTKARIERELSDKEILWVRVARGQEDVVSGVAVNIDPLKIADKIKALENEIEAFRTEADAILSEQNALTTIELDLTEVK